MAVVNFVILEVRRGIWLAVVPKVEQGAEDCSSFECASISHIN